MAARVGAVERRAVVGHAVGAGRRHQHADGAARPRARRAGDALDSEAPRHGPGVHRPRSARRQQRVVLRHAATLGDGDARGASHVLVHHVMQAERGAVGRDLQPRREAVQRCLGSLSLDPHLAAEEEAGIEVAQHEVGVRHRRLGAAAAVAGGAGLRSGALRADGERAEAAAPGDRAAAGADLDQLHGGDLDGQAGAAQEALLPCRLETPGHQRLAIVHQGELRRGAAHVEGQDAVQPGVAAEPSSGQRPGGGAGFQQLHRDAPRLGGVGQPAVGEHQEQPARDARRAQLGLQPRQVALGERPHIGVGGGGAGARVLADLRRDVRGERDGERRESPCHGVAEQALVHRVGVGVQEDRRRGSPRLRPPAPPPRRSAASRSREISTRAVGSQSLRRLASPGAGDQRPRHGEEDVVELVFPLAPDLQHVAEAGRGQQRGACAAPLDQRIGEERRGVDHARHLRRRAAGTAQHLQRARQRPARGVVGRGAFLPDGGPAGVGVVQDEVGEGAADVDAER